MESGQFRWAGGGCPHCLASRKWNSPLGFSLCGREEVTAEDQMVEAGRWAGQLLTPLHTPSWRARQDRTRERQLAEARPVVVAALQQLDQVTATI